VHWAQDYALANRELMMRNLINLPDQELAYLPQDRGGAGFGRSPGV
jgi:hypothetical protein